MLEQSAKSVAAHAEAADAVLTQLATTPDGLSQDEAERRSERFGPNRTPEPAKTHVVLRFLRHFHNALIYVLIAAAIITSWLGHPLDTAVIVFVVLANAVI
ncbi:MAG: cation-transporting P-type ATPase [Pseudomonadota bacterium]